MQTVRETTGWEAYYGSTARVVILPDGTEMGWADWWNALPAAERFALYAKVRFAIADAMLAARQAQP